MKRLKQFLGLLLVFMMAFSCITPAMAATSEVDCLDTECLDHHDHGIDEHVEDVHSTCEDEHCVASTSSISKALAKKQAACNHTWTTVTTKQPTCGTSGTYVTKCSKCGAGSPNGNGYIPATGKHTWKVTSTTNATCTANGSKSYKCTVCGQTKTETINKLGHNWNRSAANCTTAKKCTRCGVVGQGALGHNWDRSAATCTADKKCTRCGSVGQAALGHNWDRSAATCTADKKCTRCGTVGQKATGHNYKQVTTKEPTCGASGTYVTKCTVCGAGAQNGNGYISPTGNHKWDRTAATCTADKKCTVCGTVGEAAKGHAWNLSAANCTTDMKCDRCGTVNQKALGHNWDRSAATCTADKKCTRCGTVGQKATGHNYQQVTTKEPTCGTSGTYVTKCSVCGAGAQNGNGYISPTGNHKWDRTAATCTADKKCTVCGTVGETAKGHVWNVSAANCTTDKKCTVCGTVDTKATGHDWNVSAATCTVDKKCTKCGVVGQKATGHNYQQVTTKEPTCGAQGIYVTKCAVCGAGSQNGNGYISPTGDHNWVYSSTTEPTCTTEGYDLYTCTGCDHTKKDKIEKLGHDYETITTEEPTCGNAGIYVTKCKRCGTGSQNGNGYIAPTGNHKWNIDSPTCTEGQVCTVCGTKGKDAKGHTLEWGPLSISRENGTCRKEYRCETCKEVVVDFSVDLGSAGIGGTSNQFLALITAPTDVGFVSLANIIGDSIPDGFELVGFTLDPSEVDITYVSDSEIVIPTDGSMRNLYAIIRPVEYTLWELSFDATGTGWKSERNGNSYATKSTELRPDVDSIAYLSSNTQFTTEGMPSWLHVREVHSEFGATSVYFDCDPCYEVDETLPKKRMAKIWFFIDGVFPQCVIVEQYRPAGLTGSKGNEHKPLLYSIDEYDTEYSKFIKNNQLAMTKEQYYNFDGSDIRIQNATNGDYYFFRRNCEWVYESKNNLATINNYMNCYLYVDVSWTRLAVTVNEANLDGPGHPYLEAISEFRENLNAKTRWITIKEVDHHGIGGITDVGFVIKDNADNAAVFDCGIKYAKRVYQHSNLAETIGITLQNGVGIALDVASVLDTTGTVKIASALYNSAEFMYADVTDDNTGRIISGTGSLFAIGDLATLVPEKISVVGTVGDAAIRGYSIGVAWMNYQGAHYDDINVIGGGNVEDGTASGEVFEDDRINLKAGAEFYVRYIEKNGSTHNWNEEIRLLVYGEEIVLHKH